VNPTKTALSSESIAMNVKITGAARRKSSVGVLRTHLRSKRSRFMTLVHAATKS
jgi:hypothetical protein